MYWQFLSKQFKNRPQKQLTELEIIADVEKALPTLTLWKKKSFWLAINQSKGDCVKSTSTVISTKRSGTRSIKNDEEKHNLNNMLRED